MKSFKYWKRQEVQKAFGLKRVKTMALMDDWLNVDIQILTHEEKEYIEGLRRDLKKHLIRWNDVALKFFFLGPLLRLVSLHSSIYNIFSKENLIVKLGDGEANGEIDFMVAQGEQIPEAPLFCIYGNKSEKDSNNDLFGQLLIAMIASQQANEKVGLKVPIYGCYALNHLFYFSVLDEKTFSLSKPYNATQFDIFEIFAILRKTKTYINKIVEQFSIINT